MDGKTKESSQRSQTEKSSLLLQYYQKLSLEEQESITWLIQNIELAKELSGNQRDKKAKLNQLAEDAESRNDPLALMLLSYAEMLNEKKAVANSDAPDSRKGLGVKIGISEIKEQIIQALMNECDNIIFKMDVTETSNNIHLTMVGGTELVIYFKNTDAATDIYQELLDSQTIKDLYLGNLQPCNLNINHPDHSSKRKVFIEEQKKIMDFIPRELHGDFERLCSLQAGLTGTEVEDSFIKGYQIATRLILESLHQYQPGLLDK